MKRIFIASALLATLLLALVLGAGELLSLPVRHSVGPPPPGLAADTVVFEGAARQRVCGWFARGEPGRGAVLLLHGVRGDRRQMLERARFLRAEAYAVLLIDLPAHGESDGERIGFGYREAPAVQAAMRWLRQRLPGERVAVIGVSLGAASLVLAGAGARADAVVLESMYPTIAEAVADRLRMRLGAPGAWLAPVLLWQLPLRLGISAEQLRPIDHLARLQAPLLIASGTQDQHTTAAEAQRLFAAAAEPRELWLVIGAAHVDLHAFNPGAYEARVSAFLRRYLQPALPARKNLGEST